MEIISWILTIFALVVIGSFLSTYWKATLIVVALVVGVVLIQQFTIYAASVIFIGAFGVIVATAKEGERLSKSVGALKSATLLTVVVIVLAFAVPKVLGEIFSGSPQGECTRSTPQFC